MASYPPSPASQNWLVRASTKFEKSIFRLVEHKYKTKINDYEMRIKTLEEYVKCIDANYQNLEYEFLLKVRQNEDLQAKLDQFTKPEVAVKNVEKEIFKVKSWVEKDTIEEGKKRKLEYDKEIIDITALRETPPSKIFKVGPAPHLKPSPGIPKTNSKGRKRERSTSPKPSKPLEILKKKPLKRERSKSPQPAVPASFPPKPLKVIAQGKKRKKKKDEKKT